MTPKRWIDSTAAIGIVSKQGRYAATYAHRDIAFEFASWISPEQIAYKYANEADLLNVAFFGRTAKQWRDADPGRKGNIRDDADLNQLLVLANMESYNAVLIGQGKKMSERLVLLRELAVKQMETLSLVSVDSLKRLPGGDPE